MSEPRAEPAGTNSATQGEAIRGIEPDAADHRAFGQWLADERRRRNVTLESIATATRVHLRYLTAIEQGQREVLPPLPFLRGFLSAYARQLGLDPQVVLQRYQEVSGTTPPEPETPPPPPLKPPAPGRRSALSLGGVAVLLLALALVWRFGPDRGRPPLPDAPATVPPPSASPSPAPDPATSPSPSPPPEEPAGARPPSALPGEGLRLLLEGSGKSWVNAVIDKEKSREFFIQAGEKVELAARGTIVLTLGNAGAVSLTFNGRPLGPAGRPGEVKRDILYALDPVKGEVVEQNYLGLKERPADAGTRTP